MDALPAEWSTLLGRAIPFEERLVLDHLLSCVLSDSRIQVCYLFGSRARGTHSPRADFDFAFVYAEDSGFSWPSFCDMVRESLPTVHALDLIDLSTTPEPLRTRILVEGKEIHRA